MTDNAKARLKEAVGVYEIHSVKGDAHRLLLCDAIVKIDGLETEINRLRDALAALRKHYHAEGENDTAYSKDECPLCAKIEAALKL